MLYTCPRDLLKTPLSKSLINSTEYHADMTMTIVRTGLENLIESPPEYLSGRRLGLLCNPASVDNGLRHARALINARFPGQLTALFSPQHGFFSEKQDNMVESENIRDTELNIPVFSLYGKTRIPTAEMLNHLDILIIDLQDVGTRVYTFIYTVSYCLEAARQQCKKVLILDRPNPINGLTLEGNLLKPEWASFVGRYSIPMRHGLTIAELALLINDHYKIGCDLAVIPMTGWRREMFFGDTGLCWVPPSPNLPTPVSTLVYPGQVLWEGTNVSEGRGTCLPFELFGAPYLDPNKIILSVGGQRQAGAILRPVAFEPVTNKWKGKLCHGFQIHVTDPYLLNPYHLTLKLFRSAMEHHHSDFEYKPPPYEYEYERRPIDLIMGNRDIRHRIQNLEPTGTIEASWRLELKGFIETSQPYLLYEPSCQRETR